MSLAGEGALIVDTLKLLFLEDLFYFYVVLAVAEGILLVAASRRRTRRALLWALLPLGLAGVLTALASAVQTDRERIESSIRRIARAAEQQDMETIAALVDEDYHDGVNDRSRLLQIARPALRAYRVSNVRLGAMQIDPSAEPPVASVAARVAIDTPLGRADLPMRWRVEWVERDGVWKVRSAQMESSVFHGPPRAP